MGVVVVPLFSVIVQYGIQEGAKNRKSKIHCMTPKCPTFLFEKGGHFGKLGHFGKIDYFWENLLFFGKSTIFGKIYFFGKMYYFW